MEMNPGFMSENGPLQARLNVFNNISQNNRLMAPAGHKKAGDKSPANLLCCVSVFRFLKEGLPNIFRILKIQGIEQKKVNFFFVSSHSLVPGRINCVLRCSKFNQIRGKFWFFAAQRIALKRMRG